MKTKKQVKKELDAAVKFLNGAGKPSMSRLRIRDQPENNRYFVEDTSGYLIGPEHPYRPDPDTAEEALEKAQKYQMEKLKNGEVCSLHHYNIKGETSWGVNNHKRFGTTVNFNYSAETDI